MVLDNADIAACERDTWMERAENAETDLRAFRERLELAVGGYEQDGNRTLLLDRLYDLIDA